MFVSKPVEQQRARELRRRDWSLRRIAMELDVSLSSVSVWVRDVRRSRTPPPVASQADAPPSGLEKLCGRCRRRLPIEAFNRAGSERQHWCRACFTAYFKARGKLHVKQVAESKSVRRAAARKLIAHHLSHHPCVDCDEADPVVLEFDHLQEKRADLTHLVGEGYSAAALTREIRRCDVVCVNCHRERTARRGGWLRVDPDWRRKLRLTRLPGEARNVAYAYEHLLGTGCVDCGERRLCVLDFDHVAGKDASVMILAHGGYGLARLRSEIAKCEVRCANCHRRRTAREGGHYRGSLPKLPRPP